MNKVKLNTQAVHDTEMVTETEQHDAEDNSKDKNNWPAWIVFCLKT